jgi:hypothetical protein
MAITKVVSIDGTRAGRAAVVDEYGRLCKRLEALDGLVERREWLKAQIRSWYAKDSAEQEFVVEGDEYAVTVSACSFVRRIRSIRAIWKRVGATKFLDKCSMTLEAVEGLLPADELPEYLEAERKGPRRLKVMQKAFERAA